MATSRALPGWRCRRWTGTRSTRPLKGAYDFVLRQARPSPLPAATGRRQLSASWIVELQLGRVAALDQPLGGVGLGLPLLDHALGHATSPLACPRRPACRIRSPRLTCSPCLTGSSSMMPHDAGGENRALVRLGLAGNADGARMLDARRRDHGDRAHGAAGLLGLAPSRRLPRASAAALPTEENSPVPIQAAKPTSTTTAASL